MKEEIALICKNKKCAAQLVDGATFCHVCGKRQTSEPRKYIKRRNGAGTVYKLPGRRRKPYVAAKNKVIIGYYATKSEALDVIESLASKPITELYNMTFKEVYEAWKEEHFKTLSEKGVEGYEIAYKHFESLHNTRFRDLRTEHFQKVVDQLIDKGRSHSTTNKLKQLIGQMSKWSMREGVCTMNYAQFIKLPEIKRKEKEIFTEEEINKLKSSPNDAAKIVLMLIYTGMRIGELFSMEADNVFETYCVGGEKTEAGRDRKIPIPSEVRAHFAYFKERAGEGTLLIDGYDGNRSVDNFRKRDYYDLLDDLQITRKSPHTTRHTYASMAVKSGMQPEILQKILGHADYSTTSNIYVHTDVETLVSAAESLTKKKKRQTKGAKK